MPAGPLRIRPLPATVPFGEALMAAKPASRAGCLDDLPSLHAKLGRFLVSDRLLELGAESVSELDCLDL